MLEPKIPSKKPKVLSVDNHLQCFTASISTSPILHMLQIAATGPTGPDAYALVSPTLPTV